ncbi:hypothetical protein ACQ4PT_021925 [Festuca glaucescens]
MLLLRCIETKTTAAPSWEGRRRRPGGAFPPSAVLECEGPRGRPGGGLPARVNVRLVDVLGGLLLSRSSKTELRGDGHHQLGEEIATGLGRRTLRGDWRQAAKDAGNTIPLSKQLSYFRSTKAEMEGRAGSHAISSLLSRSFFLIGVGSNDMFVFAAAPDDDAAAFYGSLIASYSAAITDLYRMGARKFGIINVGMIGCVPRVRVLHATGACNDGLNQLAAGFDSALSSLLPTLAATACRASPCCGGGRLGAETDCLPNSMLCADRGHFVFWDRVHACQHAGELTAAAYYDGGLFTAPLTFKQFTRP